MKGRVIKKYTALAEEYPTAGLFAKYLRENNLLPKTDKDFMMIGRMFFGVNTHLKELTMYNSLYKSGWIENDPGKHHGKYMFAGSHKEYAYTPHAKAMKYRIKPTETESRWHENGVDWGCYDYEAWVCRIVFGPLYCGGIGGSNYGQFTVKTDDDFRRLKYWAEDRAGWANVKRRMLQK